MLEMDLADGDYLNIIPDPGRKAREQKNQDVLKERMISLGQNRCHV